MNLSRKASFTLGALMAYVAPLLAQDAKVGDLSPVVDGLTSENFGSKKAGIVTAITERTAGKLAQDAKLDALPGLLEVLEAQPVTEDASQAGITQQALDTALATTTKAATQAALKIARDIRDAEREVRPYVGDLALDSAESPEDVYRAALTALKVDVKDVPGAALKHILKAQQKTTAVRHDNLALDTSSGGSDFLKRVPGAARLNVN